MEPINRSTVRVHHHDDCEMCMRGECDGTGWRDPNYPVHNPHWKFGDPDKPFHERTIAQRFRLYRSFGHPKWVALALAPPPHWLVYLFAAAFGWNAWKFF